MASEESSFIDLIAKLNLPILENACGRELDQGTFFLGWFQLICYCFLAAVDLLYFIAVQSTLDKMVAFMDFVVYIVFAYCTREFIIGIKLKSSTKIKQYLVASSVMIIYLIITGLAFFQSTKIIVVCYNAFTFIHAYSLYLKLAKSKVDAV